MACKRPLTIGRTLAAATILLAFAPALAAAGPYVYIDYTDITFHYMRNAESCPGVGDVVGSIQLALDTNSRLNATKYSVGTNGRFEAAGGDDFAVGATYLGPGEFAMSFDADVVYLGPNNYRVVTSGAGLRGTDATTASDSFAARFQSSSIYCCPGIFTMYGHLGILGSNDAILLNTGEAGDAWTFEGTSGEPSIGLSGAPSENRMNYDRGILTEIHFSYQMGMDLDGFFGLGMPAGYQVRNYGADMKLSVIPAPGAALLALVGLGTLSRLKRRLA